SRLLAVEGRGQTGQGFGRSVLPDAFVGLHDRAVGPADRDDLAGEESGLSGGGRPVVGPQRPGVAGVAAQLPPGGDEFGGDPLMAEAFRVAGPEPGAEVVAAE